LLRSIVLSSTYRQASRHRQELKEQDPHNRLLARQDRFRVEAEVVRDLALDAGGLLDRRIGGPSIVPPFPRELPTGQFTAEALKMPTREWHRRGVYIHVQRTLTHPSLAAFDVADGNQACIRRARTTTPTQALTLLNDPTFDECARALGARVRSSALPSPPVGGEGSGVRGQTPADRLHAVFLLCLGRPPVDAEVGILVELVEKQHKLGAKAEAVWLGVARVLLNLEEFTTRE
jgi:hypothetical protein